MAGTLFLNFCLIFSEAGPELCPWSPLGWGVMCSQGTEKGVFVRQSLNGRGHLPAPAIPEEQKLAQAEP